MYSYFRGMIYDGNETYYVQPFPGDMDRVSAIVINYLLVMLYLRAQGEPAT